MKKRFMSADMVIAVLAVTSIMLGMALFIAKPLYFVPVVLIVAVISLLFFFNLRRMRSIIRNLLHGSSYAGSETQFSFNALSVPVMILSGKDLVWYNDAFKDEILNGVDASLIAVSKLLPGLEIAKASEKGGQCIRLDNKRYSVYGSNTKLDEGLFVAYVIDNTALKIKAEEYELTRPSVMHILLDTYEEILKELKESERAQLMTEVDRALERFIEKTNGFLRRVSASRYIAVVEERHVREMERNRFDLIDIVRALGNENAALTLSIGVGRSGATLQESETMALQALDMALGRGGDQVAVKSENGFEFYGGVSRSVEKRSKVKSRIIAAAMADLMGQSDSVLIMGHKMSDLDSVGAAIGVLRFCKMQGKPAAIVINKKQSLAQNLIKQYEDAGNDDFISSDEVIDGITYKTLLIVVDTHLKAIVESRQVYEKCKNVVVIDHHRKSVGHIDNAVVFYHEPYASSASELVSELLQYAGEKEQKPTPLEAQALLSGIMLDTRNFSLHTGVRTFEAAAYLRRLGAQTQEVKKLFASSIESYSMRSQLVTQAQMYLGCAVVVSDNLPPDAQVIVPQAANDLLTIEGVEASFVAVEQGDQINISARSMGAVNVQVIMERLGGGGHLTMAGAQLKDTDLAQAQHALFEAIQAYRDTQTKEK